MGKSCNGEIVMFKLLAETMSGMLLVMEGIRGCVRSGPGRAQVMSAGEAWLGRERGQGVVTGEVCRADGGDTETRALGHGGERSATVWTSARMESMVMSRVVSLNLLEERDQMGSVVVGSKLRLGGGADKGACNGEIVMGTGAGTSGVVGGSLEKRRLRMESQNSSKRNQILQAVARVIWRGC